MKSQLLSGGIENRFINSFSKKTLKKESLATVAGDEQIHDYIAYEYLLPEGITESEPLYLAQNMLEGVLLSPVPQYKECDIFNPGAQDMKQLCTIDLHVLSKLKNTFHF